LPGEFEITHVSEDGSSVCARACVVQIEQSLDTSMALHFVSLDRTLDRIIADLPAHPEMRQL